MLRRIHSRMKVRLSITAMNPSVTALTASPDASRPISSERSAVSRNCVNARTPSTWMRPMLSPTSNPPPRNPDEQASTSQQVNKSTRQQDNNSPPGHPLNEENRLFGLQSSHNLFVPRRPASVPSGWPFGYERN